MPNRNAVSVSGGIVWSPSLVTGMDNLLFGCRRDL